MSEKVVKLTMTENQAKILSKACDLYSRIRIGQFQEIIWTTLVRNPMPEDFQVRRDAVEYLLNGVKTLIYPELVGNASYGVGKFEDADTAYDVHQVLRNFFGDEREPYRFGPDALPKMEVDTIESEDAQRG